MKKNVSLTLTLALISNLTASFSLGQIPAHAKPEASEKITYQILKQDTVNQHHNSAPGPAEEKTVTQTVPDEPATTLPGGAVAKDQLSSESIIKSGPVIPKASFSRDKAVAIIADGADFTLGNLPMNQTDENTVENQIYTISQTEFSTTGENTLFNTGSKEHDLNQAQDTMHEKLNSENKQLSIIKAEDYLPKSGMATPNLTPYQPTGWDSKIVISSVTGTHTSNTPFFNTQTLYVDWAVINNGTTDVITTFYSKLYLDGALKGTWNTAGLAAGNWTSASDFSLGTLTPGSHQIKIVVDANDNISETNESDNEYTRTITVYPYVNLTAYKPTTWDDKIVLSTVTGTNTSDPQIFDTDNIYLDWSIANVSANAITTTFYIDLFVDGVWKSSWSRTGLGANTFTTQQDYLVGKLAAGNHTFKIVIDWDNYVPESNESDNEYSRTITVVNKNLLPYQRSGWDNKLVLSTVTGTNTSASAFYNNQDIFVDWSVWNNGSAAVTETFHSKLYVDGTQKGVWFTAGLAANHTAYVADYNIGKLAIGNHTIQIIVDSDGEVAETNEADNSYSRTIYVGPSYNLTPHQPAGWDDKIVLSTTTGTNTSATVIYDTENIYLDWAVINNALNDISTSFYVRLYIDGVYRAGWNRSGLAHGSYTYAVDYNFGKLSAGTHTVRIFADADGQIAESDETDNEYTRTFTVVNKNLLPHQPIGWDNKIILSTVTGTNTSASSFCEGQNLYLDYAILNEGSAAITETFSIRLYIDGAPKATWTKSGLYANTYYSIQDYSLGSLAAGPHTAKIVADVLGDVTETSETDNEYTRNFTISTCKNLKPYKPSTWDNALVLSTVIGTHTSATTIYTTQNIYVDLAVINDGMNNITESFNIKLYVDGSLKNTWTKAGLSAGAEVSYSDYNLGMLPVGDHTFKIVADADGAVAESDESDNEYTRTITVTVEIPPAPTIGTITQPTCAVATGSVVLNNLPATGTWTINGTPGSIVKTGSGTSTTISNLAAGTTYTFTVTNSAGGTSPASENAVINSQPQIPAQPGTIGGNTTACSGSSQTYTVSPVTGATSYSWQLPSGWGGSSTSNSITVTTGTAGGTISVTANNECGSSTQRTLSVTVISIPAQPGAISGSNIVCSGSSETYTITAVTGATSYTWHLPSGWSGSSTSNSITVTTGTAGGTISVTASNPCGTSTERTLTVAMAGLPSITTASIASQSSTTAAGGGNITSNGGAAVTEAGVCWSTSVNPTISDTRTRDAVTSGPFVSTLTGLTAGVTYHVRAYATNCAGTAYGSDVEYRHNPTDVTDASAEDILVYPNPVSGILTIKYSDDHFDRINIMGSRGDLLRSMKVIIPVQFIDFRQFEPGLYIIEFIKNNGETRKVKLIKN